MLKFWRIEVIDSEDPAFMQALQKSDEPKNSHRDKPKKKKSKHVSALS